MSIAATEVDLLLGAHVRNKYLALKICPEGFGVHGLLNSFFNLAVEFSGTWLAKGATQYTAQFQKENDIDSIRRVSSLAAGLTVIVSASTIVILFAGREFVLNHFLTQEIPSLYYLLFLGALIGKSIRPI